MTNSRGADEMLPPTLRSYGAFNKTKLVQRARLLVFSSLPLTSAIISSSRSPLSPALLVSQ